MFSLPTKSDILADLHWSVFMFGNSSSATIMQLQPVSLRIVDTLMPLTVHEERYLLESLSFRQKFTFSFTLRKAVQQKDNLIYSGSR